MAAETTEIWSSLSRLGRDLVATDGTEVLAFRRTGSESATDDAGDSTPDTDADDLRILDRFRRQLSQKARPSSPIRSVSRSIDTCR